MRAHSSRHDGFTLIELMIVVAIIGILSATAVTLFVRFQLRSRTAEAKTNLSAIRVAEEAYYAERGIYLPAPAAPGVPTASRQPWPAAPPGFDTVGYAPEGGVYFAYAVTLGGPNNTAYSAGAQGDLDGGGNTSDFGYVHADPAGNFAADPFGGGCAAGVFNPSNPGVPLLNSVGGCTATDGESDF
jgi:type IV pilus assembly protein PilA